MSDSRRIRAVIGALVPLISVAFITSAVIADDWYSGSAERGTESEIGWWNSSVDYDLFNGTIWVGENDNLLGIPGYQVYTLNYTGQQQTVVTISWVGISLGIVLSLVTIVFGSLTAFRKVNGILPFLTGITAVIMIAIPGLLLYSELPKIVESDLELLRPELAEDIPEDEMHMLETNLSHGNSFKLLLLSMPSLIAAPLFFIGFHREGYLSSKRLAKKFYKDPDVESFQRERPVKTRNQNVVRRGSLYEKEEDL